MSGKTKKTGKDYWRSLAQLDDTKEYRRQILDDYRENNSGAPAQFSRRNFLTLMGASMALAGLAGCRRPVEKIVPYVEQPEEVIPGIAQHYATTMPLGTSAYGLIVECHEGRPTKIEGNPSHPSSQGSSNLFMQAAILNLYDPDRSKKVMQQGVEKNYDDLVTFWREQYGKFIQNKGRGLAVLSESFSSPTLYRLRNDFLRLFPEARWAAYEPISDENLLNVIRDLEGKPLRPVYHYDKARIIVSIDADFMNNESESLSAARGFTTGRISPHVQSNRLYVIESGFSITGGMADNRLQLRSTDIGQFVLALCKELNGRGLKLENLASRANVSFDKRWMEWLPDDLANAKGKSLVVAGRHQPKWVHEAVMRINQRLQNVDSTITFYEDKNSLQSNLADFGNLSNDINDGRVDTLIMLGGNPVYNAPADFEFDKLLDRVNHSIHLSDYADETSRLCEWHIPRAHFLEKWGDACSVNGTMSIIQPMIAPLFDGRSDAEIYSLLATGRNIRGYEIIRETWKKLIKGDFEKSWRRVLHDGLYDEDKPNPITPRREYSGDLINDPPISTGTAVMSDKIEAVFRPSVLHDGRFANNGWLQELPDPVTKLVWDNAAIVNQKTAAVIGAKNGDIVKLKTKDREIETPIWVIPGWADYSVGLALGYGRRNVGRVADNAGVNTYPLRTSEAMQILRNVRITRTGKTYQMSNTQDHNRMEGRPIIREATLIEYRKNPNFAREAVEHPPLESIFPDYDYSKGYQWGMVIDLNACIGCGVCTIACQSENNIPIVGKKQVGKGREMHWLRVDRYFEGRPDNPRMVHMPVPCQHCENAPCEQVCPVAATTHDKEGLNNMTYNRCIGTRYCSNNCPYKVRKFNFFNYTKDLPEVVKMAQNPDVTVRFRGVMEKCTFCIQRINRTKLAAKENSRVVHNGEFQTACQQACPTKAIHFGNINDSESTVAGMKKQDRNYELLAEFNVRPRNSYLAKIRNPNPNLMEKDRDEDKH